MLDLGNYGWGRALSASMEEPPLVACLIKLMCMLTNSLTASYYAIGAKGRYLYLWILAVSGYLLVGSWQPIWDAGRVWVAKGEVRVGAGSHNPEKDTSILYAPTLQRTFFGYDYEKRVSYGNCWRSYSGRPSVKLRSTQGFSSPGIGPAKHNIFFLMWLCPLGVPPKK